MSKIKRITLIPLRVTVPRERVCCPPFMDQMLQRDETTGKWKTDGTFFADMPIYAVKVESDSGPVGWSDSSRYAASEEFQKEAQNFIGKHIDEIDARTAMLDVTQANQKAKDRGHQYVHPCKALEIAALDWKARQQDIPLWKLFGEKVRDGLRVEYWSGFRTPEGAAQVTQEAVDQGFLGLKLKSKVDMDIAGISKAVFDTGSPDFHLNIDPNGRWDTAEITIPLAKQMLAASPNVLLEDPIYDDLDGLTKIRRETGIHIGMTIQVPEQVGEAVAAQAADSFNIGGTYHQMIACAEQAEQHGKPVWIGSGCDTGLADLVAVHLGCTLEACTIGSDLIGNFYRVDDLLVEPIKFVGGFAQIPDGPGRGIDTDLNAIEKYRIGDPVIIE